MSSDLRRFPRLRTADAIALAEKVAENPAAVAPDTRHPNQIYAPIGGPVVDEASLRGVRHDVLAALEEARADHDAAPSGEGITWQTRFDVHVGRALHEALQLSRSEAAVDGVWSWLTLVLLPDVALHRYPDPSTARLTGGLRNVFSVTWWPVEVLGDLVEPSSGRALQVDEIVGLFERRTLSRDNQLAVSYARTIRTLATKDRMKTSREFAKAVRRVGAHTCWAIADHQRLEALLEDAAERVDAAADDNQEEPASGPIEGSVRLGTLELPISLERSDADLQPTGVLDWTAIKCPTAEDPELLTIEGRRIELRREGNTRAGHPRFRAHERLPNGVTISATVVRRPDDVYLECELS